MLGLHKYVPVLFLEPALPMACTTILIVGQREVEQLLLHQLHRYMAGDFILPDYCVQLVIRRHAQQQQVVYQTGWYNSQ